MADDCMPILLAARSKAWFSGRLSVGIVGSNPAGAWISLPCECCVLICSGRASG